MNLNFISNLVITGANGFVGKSVVDYLSTLDYSALPQRISLVTRDGLRYRVPLSLEDRISVLNQDLTDEWKLPRTTSHILNFAADGSLAPYSESSCLRYLEINKNLISWIRNQTAGVSVFHASTGACFGEVPLLGETKQQDQKEYFRRNRLEVESLLSEQADLLGFDLRMGRLYSFSGKNILQKKQYAISTFISSSIESKTIKLFGDSRTQRSYLHQDAMSEWILQALTSSKPYRDLQIGSNHSIEMGELAEFVAEKTNANILYPINPEPGDIYIPNNLDTRTKLGVSEGINWKDAVIEMIAEARVLLDVGK